MQDNKKTIADEMFEHANIINNASRTANLYGKLFALQEMQIYVLSEIKKVKELIDELESYNPQARVIVPNEDDDWSYLKKVKDQIGEN